MILRAGNFFRKEYLTMCMNGDQERRAETLVAVLSGLGSARLSWRVMHGVRVLEGMIRVL